MAKIDAVDIPKLLMTEGAAPSTPAASKVYMYAKADGLMYSKDDAGAETLMSSGPSGSITFKGCRAYYNTTQSISTATDTAVLCNAEEYDTNTLHDTGSNTSRFTANATGKWRVTALISLPANAVQWQVWLRVDGTTKLEPSVRQFGNASGVQYAVLSQVLTLTSTQYVEVMVRQASGGSLSIGSATANAQTYVEFEFVGS